MAHAPIDTRNVARDVAPLFELLPSLRAELPRGATPLARIAEGLRRAANALVRATERLLFRRSRRRASTGRASKGRSSSTGPSSTGPSSNGPISNGPRRIGVWRVGMIGDTLVALPALAAVRAAHPDAELVLFTSPGPASAPGAAELLEHSRLVDRVVRWTREDLARGGLRELCRRLRAEPVDRLYLLPQDRTTPRAELRLLVALRIAGVRDVRGANVTTAHFLPDRLARAHDREFTWTPIATRLLEQVQSNFDAGAAAPEVCTESQLVFDAARRERALLHLARIAPGGEPLLCLAPGAKLEHKRWPTERFGAVARGWIDRGGRAVILGGPGDVELAEQITDAAGIEIPSLCGVTDLLESAALLERADALVSNDTGTMHLGAAVGTPLVAIFSGWDRRGAWDPWCLDPERPPTVLRRQVPCHPCLASVCSNRSGGVPACLDLAADAVLAATLRVARRVPGEREETLGATVDAVSGGPSERTA